MAGKAGDGAKKQKQKHSMEAKFIRTKPLPTQSTQQSNSSSNSNQAKIKGEKKNTEGKEKDQLKEQYWAKLLASGFSKDNLKSNDPKATFSEADWMEIRQYFNHAYHPNNEESKQYIKKNCGKLAKVIKRLCAKDSQQLLLFLESQVQEFVIEVKVKLLEVLKKPGQPSQIARNFLTKLVEFYASLSSGASCLTGALQDLEDKHLAMFGMSWEDLNRLLFERCVHSDPVIQLKIPQFVGQLRGSLNQKDKGGFYGVFQRLLTLEEQMTTISEKWKRVESFIHEKNVTSLSKMVSQLKIDLCDNKGTKKQCSCSICSSSLLQQLSQLGLAQHNGKGSKDKFFSMLEQRELKLKTNCCNESKGGECAGGKQAQTNSKNQAQANSSKQNASNKQQQQQPQQKSGKGNSNSKNLKPEPPITKIKELTKTKGKSGKQQQQQQQQQQQSQQQQKQAVNLPPANAQKKGKQKNSTAAPEKEIAVAETKPVKKEIEVKESDPGDSRSLRDLLEFIEGNDNANKDEKKAAKKARQKLKKTQEIEVPYKAPSKMYEEPPSAVIKVPKPTASAQFLPQKGDKKEPQMVTIRRVMEPSSSEPTVTITLKGDTPDHDKVLFTLVNGQAVKEDAKGKGKKGQQQQQQSQPPPVEKEKKKKNKKKSENKQAEPTMSAPPSQPLHMNHHHQQMPHERFSVNSSPYQPVPKPHVTVTPIMGPPYAARSPQEMSVSDFCAQQPKLGPFRAPTVPTKGFQDEMLQDQYNGQFSLQNIKLPPGITITKVEAPKLMRVEPPPPVKKEEPPSEYGYQQGGTMIVNMPQPLPPSSYQPHNLTAAQMGSMRNMGMQNPNVIVVDTGKLMDEEVPNHNYVNNQNGMWQQSNGTLKHPNLVSGGILLNGNHMTNGQEQGNGGGKKKKNKKKGKKAEEWNLVESVFAPKDIDLDAVDDDERELEAFKRFCFNSVPPEHKEKVHLNLKDLVIKKKP